MAAALPLTRVADVSGHSLLAQIGNTPLVFLEKISATVPGVEIYVKDESRNPGGSVKDRPALNMVLDGERRGLLTPDKIILDATSGNTGIAYAMIGAARGYKVKLCLPANASLERKRILKATAPRSCSRTRERARTARFGSAARFTMRTRDTYFYPDQYNNPANWQAHFNTTGVGDPGPDRGPHYAFRRVARHERNVHGRDPAVSAGRAARQMLFGAAVLRIPRPGRTEAYADGDRARHLRRVAAGRQSLDRDRGRVCDGAATGARRGTAGRRLDGRKCRGALCKLARAEQRGRRIVTIACDGADKYLSEHFWDD